MTNEQQHYWHQHWEMPPQQPDTTQMLNVALLNLTCLAAVLRQLSAPSKGAME